MSPRRFSLRFSLALLWILNAPLHASDPEAAAPPIRIAILRADDVIQGYFNQEAVRQQMDASFRKSEPYLRKNRILNKLIREYETGQEALDQAETDERRYEISLTLNKLAQEANLAREELLQMGEAYKLQVFDRWRNSMIQAARAMADDRGITHLYLATQDFLPTVYYIREGFPLIDLTPDIQAKIAGEG